MHSSTQKTPASLEELLNGPALQPPDGVVPNFTDPRRLTQVMLAVELLFLLSTTIAVLVRLYTKLIINRKGNLEDLLCTISWGLFVAIFVLIQWGGVVGAGRHQWDVRLKDLKHFLYALHIISIVNGCVVLTIKASILLQYVTIFSIGQRRWFFWTCHTFIWLNVVFYTTCFFLEIFSCKPISKAWDPFIATGSCPINVEYLNIAASSINVISDLAILLLPQGIIWRLKMDTSKRLGVSLIFATALLACIFASVRLYYGVILYYSDDITYYTSMFAIHMCAELGLAIVVSCLPAFPKFVRTMNQTTLFSKISTSLYTLLGVGKDKSTNKETSYHAQNQVGFGRKPRQDTFQRLVEQHELQSAFREDNRGTVTSRVETC
ncbi:hypothetical protein EAE96_006534 [Botrytis aclada]|nr:hypothetical protein EAE96_006534 [Botrytis aclada]